MSTESQGREVQAGLEMKQEPEEATSPNSGILNEVEVSRGFLGRQNDMRD